MYLVLVPTCFIPNKLIDILHMTPCCLPSSRPPVGPSLVIYTGIYSNNRCIIYIVSKYTNSSRIGRIDVYWKVATVQFCLFSQLIHQYSVAQWMKRKDTASRMIYPWSPVSLWVQRSPFSSAFSIIKSALEKGVTGVITHIRFDDHCTVSHSGPSIVPGLSKWAC